jgi:hypothetical protein
MSSGGLFELAVLTLTVPGPEFKHFPQNWSHYIILQTRMFCMLKKTRIKLVLTILLSFTGPTDLECDSLAASHQKNTLHYNS